MPRPICSAMQTADIALVGDSPQSSPRTPRVKRVGLVGVIMLISGTALLYGAAKFGSGSSMLSTSSFVGEWANRFSRSGDFLPREDNNNGSSMARYPALSKPLKNCGFFHPGACGKNGQCTCGHCGKHLPSGYPCSTDDNCQSRHCHLNWPHHNIWDCGGKCS